MNSVFPYADFCSGERTVDFEDDKKKLVEYGAKDGSVIVFVDLGPQVNKQRVCFHVCQEK